jgi:hypothetical protein
MVKFSAGQPSRPDWYDRNPKSVVLSSQAVYSPHGTTQRWTYTVPAGKKAIFELAQLTMRRITVGTVFSGQNCYMSLTPNGGSPYQILYCELLNASPAIGDKELVSTQGTIVLCTGDAISVSDQDAGTGGTIEFTEIMKYTEFDA